MERGEKSISLDNLARVALGKKDLAGATGQAEEFRKGASVSKNPAQAKQAHELDGIVALAALLLARQASSLAVAAPRHHAGRNGKGCQYYHEASRDIG